MQAAMVTKIEELGEPCDEPIRAPSSQGDSGYEPSTFVSNPYDFMAHWYARQAELSRPVPRQIIFKGIPEWANITDVLCLVFGGPIERIWSENPREITVQFLYEGDCETYYDRYCYGIRVGEHLIEVEQGHCPVLSDELKAWIVTGTTRCVQLDVSTRKTLKELEDVTRDFDLDHISYHVEPNKPGRAYFFFCSIMSGCEMMKRLLEPGWLDCPARFLPDPCELAQGFHANTLLPSRMINATAEVLQED